MRIENKELKKMLQTLNEQKSIINQKLKLSLIWLTLNVFSVFFFVVLFFLTSIVISVKNFSDFFHTFIMSAFAITSLAFFIVANLFTYKSLREWWSQQKVYSELDNKIKLQVVELIAEKKE